MNKIIDAIAQLYAWIGEYLAKVLPAEVYEGLMQLPKIDFDSFKTEEE